MSELDDKLAKQSDLDEQREQQMNEIQEKLNELDQRIKAHDDEINKCVTWDQISVSQKLFEFFFKLWLFSEIFEKCSPFRFFSK